MSQNFKTKFPEAVLLAAGLGTRLRPLTYKIPKPALPLAAIPFLFYNLALLQEAGIKHVVINLHHLPKIIKDLFRRKIPGLTISFSEEKNLLGTGGGIKKAAAHLRGDKFWLVNGDILFDSSLKKIEDDLIKSQALASLCVVPSNRAQVNSFAEYNKKNYLIRIAGQGTASHDATSQAIYSGTALLDKKLFIDIGIQKPSCLIREVIIPELMRSENTLRCSLEKNYWTDLGTLDELKTADVKFWTQNMPPRLIRLREQAQKLYLSAN